MSINIEITYSSAKELAVLTEALADKPAMHERIARDALFLVKDFGKDKAKGEHRTASMLGATPTRHLEEAYEGINALSDDSSARLLVPGRGRLRAAFGSYVLKPQNGKTYLTIPIHKDVYGERAGESTDLKFAKMGGKNSGTGRQAFLVRDNEDGTTDFMYFLTTSVNIKEDATLIPFDKIYNQAGRSVGDYLDDAIERSLA